MRLGEEIVLRAGPYAARVSPDAGARLTSLTWADGSRSHDLIVPLDAPPPFDPHHWPSGGAFAMAPYSNRLGGATFTWGARRIHLTSPPGETYALLGFVHRTGWQVRSRGPAEAVLSYTHRPGDEGWPWRFELTMQVALDEGGATVRLCITNLSDEAMPAGLGWHPYHPAQGFARQPQARLRLSAHARRDVGLAGLEWLEPHRGRPDAHVMALVSADLQHQTNVFEDWSGAATMPLDKGLRIAMKTSGARHLVMHAAKELAYLCLEPVTLLPGALQVYDAGQSAALIALAPQCSREIAWHCGVMHGESDDAAAA